MDHLFVEVRLTLPAWRDIGDCLGAGRDGECTWVGDAVLQPYRLSLILGEKDVAARREIRPIDEILNASERFVLIVLRVGGGGAVLQAQDVRGEESSSGDQMGGRIVDATVAVRADTWIEFGT